MWKAGKLEKHKENKMTWKMLPEKLTACFRHADVILLRFLHCYNNQVY